MAKLRRPCCFPYQIDRVNLSSPSCVFLNSICAVFTSLTQECRSSEKFSLPARLDFHSGLLFKSPGAPAPQKLPGYSAAVQVGATLYVSGQLGVDPTTKQLVSGGIEAECRQALENIGTVLKTAGVSFNNGEIRSLNSIES